jgi:hypothetical protein
MARSTRKWLALLLLAIGGGSAVPGFAYCSIELNGDSILYGYANRPGMQLEITPETYLRARVGVWIDNRTAAGLNTRDLVNGYTEPFPGTDPALYPRGPQAAYAALPHTSTLTVLQVGANDYARADFDAETFRGDYRHLIATTLNNGSLPLVTGVSQLDLDRLSQAQRDNLAAINTVIHQVAAETGTAHAGWDSMPVQTIDGVHPDQDSSLRLSERLLTELDRLCALVNQPGGD